MLSLSLRYCSNAPGSLRRDSGHPSLKTRMDYYCKLTLPARSSCRYAVPHPYCRWYSQGIIPLLGLIAMDSVRVRAVKSRPQAMLENLLSPSPSWGNARRPYVVFTRHRQALDCRMSPSTAGTRAPRRCVVKARRYRCQMLKSRRIQSSASRAMRNTHKTEKVPYDSSTTKVERSQSFYVDGSSKIG